MFSPTQGHVKGFYTLLDIDNAIGGARVAYGNGRTAMDGIYLSTVLRYRFLHLGDMDDYRESVDLLKSIPRPRLEDVTLAPDWHRKHYADEERWLRLQPWLNGEGYDLRSRFRPGWEPSWDKGDGFRRYGEDWFPAYDSYIDATRIEDGAPVWLKLCPVDSSELDIAAYFMSSTFRTVPSNHTCPLLDYLFPPLIDGRADWIVVTPLLRDVLDPFPETVEELTGVISSLAEGLVFMHDNNVAHRDICLDNVMMDARALVPTGWSAYSSTVTFPPNDEPSQPIRVESRSRVPVKYYFIDFGLSSIFPSFEERKLVVGRLGQNRTTPELSNRVPYDPFALDIRMFGDMIKTMQSRFLDLEFLQPLVDSLVSDDPTQRLDARAMFRTLRDLLASRGKASRRAPLRLRGERNVMVWLQHPFRLTAATLTSVLEFSKR